MSIIEINRDSVTRHELDKAIETHGHVMADITDLPDLGIADLISIIEPETVILPAGSLTFTFDIFCDTGLITIKLDNLETLGNVLQLVGTITHNGVSGTLDVEVRDSAGTLIASLSRDPGDTDKGFAFEPICFGIARWWNRSTYSET